MPKDRILVVDDDKLLRTMLSDLFRDEYDVVTAADGEEGLATLAGAEFAAVVSDLMMPKMNGLELLQKCMQEKPQIVRILVTSSTDMKDAENAVNVARVHRFIIKPIREIEVLAAVKGAIHANRLEQENKRLMGALQVAVEQLREREQELEHELDVRTRELKDVMDQMLAK